MSLKVHKYFLGVRDKLPHDSRQKLVTCVEAGGHRWLAATNGFAMHLERVPEQEELEPGTYLAPVRFSKSPMRELFPVRSQTLKPWAKLPLYVEGALANLERCTWEYTDQPLLEAEAIQTLQRSAPENIVAYIGVSEGIHKALLGNWHLLEGTPGLAFYNAGYVLKAIRWLEYQGKINAFCIQSSKQQTTGILGHSLTLATYGDYYSMPSTQETVPSKMAVIMGLHNPALSNSWPKTKQTELLCISDEKPKEQAVEPPVEAHIS